MNPEVALLMLKVLEMISAGMKLAPKLRADKERHLAAIERMIREDRGPSDEEYAELAIEGSRLTDAIRVEAGMDRILSGRRPGDGIGNN